jgi:putative phosphoribosyl transferase
MKDYHERDVPIGTNGEQIAGTLSIPSDAKGLVIFAHGSGSSRFSARNRAVARILNDAGFATLLMDLLTRSEERVDEHTREHRFNIDLLGQRVITAVDWTHMSSDVRHLPIGLFGASTGAAAALVAAAHRPSDVSAVVSRGGRPDLAGEMLARVEAPTLLIVGGADVPVIALNREALRHLTGEKHLAIVPGATHLFEEPGAMELVSALARDWFTKYMVSAPSLHGAR